MRADLSQATFIIPIRIESPDRLRNVITTTAFLLENFDTNIIIQEVDKHSVFEKEALPILEDIVEVDIWKNFNFIHKKSCLLYTSPSPRDLSTSRMPSSA